MPRKKKHQKRICKLCERVTLAYAGGTSNLFNHLEAKHPVAYTKAFLKECSMQKQTTLGTFSTACSRANRITTLIAKCVARDSETLTLLFAGLNFKLKGRIDYPDIRLFGHPDIWVEKSNNHCSPI